MLLLSESEQHYLLDLARRTLEGSLRGNPLGEVPPPSGELAEPRGAFVTLETRGRLRGCIGYVEPLKPLYQTVRECALAAALHDPRFEPVRAEELGELRLEISVLSPLVDLPPEQIEVGRHGILITDGACRGLLLPQVAEVWKWDREQFLDATCQKAGLDRQAWRHGARIQGFTAQVFGEPVRQSRTPCSAS